MRMQVTVGVLNFLWGLCSCSQNYLNMCMYYFCNNKNKDRNKRYVSHNISFYLSTLIISLPPAPCPTLLPYIAFAYLKAKRCVNCLNGASLSSSTLHYAPLSLSSIMPYSPDIRLTTMQGNFFYIMVGFECLIDLILFRNEQGLDLMHVFISKGTFLSVSAEWFSCFLELQFYSGESG